MTEQQRLKLIANAVASNATEISPRFQGLLEDLLTEGIVLEHGIQHASKQDIEQEFVSLDSVNEEEEEDFDSDENLVDMSSISGEMREIFLS